MRCNRLSGPLIDFAPLAKLRNVWFDTQDLTGTLAALGGLKNLTYLEAAGNKLSGPVPPSLCRMTCHAGGNANLTCPLPEPGCCMVSKCGKLPTPTPTPPIVDATIGGCYPQ